MQIYKNPSDNPQYSLTNWFQPIYDVKNNTVLGYEALLRDTSPLHASPEDIFEAAARKGCQDVLDLRSIAGALNLFSDKAHLLFVNIFTSTMLEPDFLAWWEAHVPLSTPIVLELSEKELILNWQELRAVTKELTRRGVKIAVDDMGAAYSCVREYIELEPDFIKLDRYFAQNLSLSTKKQRTVKSLVNLFSDTATLIIEGIEKDEDLDVAKLAGITYAQGYLLGRPSPIENCFVMN